MLVNVIDIYLHQSEKTVNHSPVCAEQVVHWPYCLDFPLHRLAQFFSISSTHKRVILFVLLSPKSEIFAEKPHLARCLGGICALSKWALHTRWSFVEQKWHPELLRSHYFRRILFLGKLLKENCSLCVFELVFAFIMQRAIFAERDDTLGFLEVPLLQLILPTIHKS